MDYHSIYQTETPEFLLRLCLTPPLRRLADVGMNCGCEYTAFPRFAGIGRYSRLEHSLGAALIVWRFTRSEAQAAAALLHDAATPVFAHVVDFLRGDYLEQTATDLRQRRQFRPCLAGGARGDFRRPARREKRV